MKFDSVIRPKRFRKKDLNPNICANCNAKRGDTQEVIIQLANGLIPVCSNCMTLFFWRETRAYFEKLSQEETDYLNNHIKKLDDLQLKESQQVQKILEEKTKLIVDILPKLQSEIREKDVLITQLKTKLEAYENRQ